MKQVSPWNGASLTGSDSGKSVFTIDGVYRGDASCTDVAQSDLTQKATKTDFEQKASTWVGRTVAKVVDFTIFPAFVVSLNQVGLDGRQLLTFVYALCVASCSYRLRPAEVSHRNVATE